MKKRFVEPYSDPRWWWEGKYIPVCFECAHFDGMVKGKPRCKAFPEGIPREIIQSCTFKHDEPYPGDHGVRFEQYEDKKGL